MGKTKNWSLAKINAKTGSYVKGKYWVHDWLKADAYAVQGRTPTAVINFIDVNADEKQTVLESRESLESSESAAIEKVREYMKRYPQQELVDELIEDIQAVTGYSKEEAKNLLKNQRVQGTPGRLQYNQVMGDFRSFELGHPYSLNNKGIRVAGWFVEEGNSDVTGEDDVAERDTWYLVEGELGDENPEIKEFTSRELFVEEFEKAVKHRLL